MKREVDAGNEKLNKMETNMVNSLLRTLSLSEFLQAHIWSIQCLNAVGVTWPHIIDEYIKGSSRAGHNQIIICDVLFKLMSYDTVLNVTSDYIN